ncbi:MAG: hypothetical protein ACJ73N_03910 [Bryobacteraceae bacterium]
MPQRVCKLPLVLLLSVFLPASLSARERWTEINIGPFYVDTDGDVSTAREALTQLEQVRWVLGGLLENPNLQSTWPIRVILTKSETAKTTGQFLPQNAAARNGHGELGFVKQPAPDGEFAWQNPAVLHGQYLLVTKPGTRLPLFEIAGILLDSNTPRLPGEVESGLRQLLDTLEAKGSRVTWGGPPPHSDINWARIQLFATKFEYSASFHIFLKSLASGGTFRAAEQNAFHQPSDSLEKEAAARLASANWQAVSVSGRPLDPRRDFGEHTLPSPIVETYLADGQLLTDRKAAAAVYHSAIEAGGEAGPLGFEGLAQIARFEGSDPGSYLDEARRLGSHSAPVYVASAEDLPPEQAIPLLKRAAQLNPRWAEPVFLQAQLAENPSEKESLLRSAIELNRREPEYWITLAKTQTADGHAAAAQGSWLRAEEAAGTENERARIHQLRLQSEEERLNAADAAREQEREAVHIANRRAQRSQTDRVRAAEEKANRALDAEAGGSRPESVVPWTDVVPHKQLDGMLTRVDCLGSDARLTLQSRNGASTPLLLKNSSEFGLACGDQHPPPRLSVSFAVQPDERLKTSGIVMTLKIHPTR